MEERSITLQLSKSDHWTIKDMFGHWEDDADDELFLNSAFAINDKTFGNQGVQIQYNNGNPRTYMGDGANQYFKYDGTNVSWAGTNTSLTTGGKLTANEIDCRGIFRAITIETDTVSAIGGNLLLSKGADVLATTMTALDSCELVIEGNETFEVGDMLEIKDGADHEWFEVTDVSSDLTTYTVTRDKAGDYGADSNPTWEKGASVANYGASGDGLIRMTASDANAPYLQVETHAGAPWSALTTRLRIGNLNGYLGYSSDIYGIGIGDTDNFIKYDPTDGIQIQINAADAITIKSGGDIKLEAATSNPGKIKFVGSSYTTLIGNYDDTGNALDILPDTGDAGAIVLRLGVQNYEFKNVRMYAKEEITIYSRNSADQECGLQFEASATDAQIILRLEDNGVLTYLAAYHDDGTSLYFAPHADKVWDLGGASNQWKNIYGESIYQDGTKVCRCVTGSYTGDGTTSKAITGVGFTPKFVKIWLAIGDGGVEVTVETTTEMMARDAQGLANHIDGSGNQRQYDNLIISLDSDGFTVSDDNTDSNPNSNGANYDYMCLG